MYHSWLRNTGRRTYFETNPLASADFCLDSALTPAGPLGSGSYRSEGSNTSSSSESISILRKAYSAMMGSEVFMIFANAHRQVLTHKRGEFIGNRSGGGCFYKSSSLDRIVRVSRFSNSNNQGSIVSLGSHHSVIHVC